MCDGGIIVHHVDTTQPEKVQEVLSSKTTMVLLETPTKQTVGAAVEVVPSDHLVTGAKKSRNHI
jgi:cystathionine beta-lyase/cystathionine gamma-synthase